jgi:hypothetical protein
MFGLLPDDADCWLAIGWEIPRDFKISKFNGFLGHCVARTRLNVGLEFSTRVARIEDGEDKGDFIGLLPLMSQFLEWPEDIKDEYPLNQSYLTAKRTVFVPIDFLLPWFSKIDRNFFSVITGEELDAELTRELSGSENASPVDLAPYLMEIFGEISSISVLCSVAKFVNLLMGVIILKRPKSIQGTIVLNV